MPPKRKTRGKKRSIGKKRSRLSSAARGAKRRVSAAARYTRRNPGTAALGGLAGLGALGLGGYEAYLAAKRHGLKKGRSFTGDQVKEAIEFEKFKRSNPYESPTGRFARGVKDYNYRATGSGFLDRIMPSRIKKRQQKAAEAEATRQRNTIYGDMVMRKREEAARQAAFDKHKRKSSEYRKLLKSEFALNDAARRGRMESIGYDPEEETKKAIAAFTGQGRPGPISQIELGRMGYAQGMKNFMAQKDLEAAAFDKHKRKSSEYRKLLKSEFALNDAARRGRMAQRSLDYGKRRRRKRKSSFGKKVKKPSAATKRMCKKLKVRLTVKRGGKRVYKSEKVLKKQCKTAMKRKKKKSKKKKSKK
jgi:hypothetical protein